MPHLSHGWHITNHKSPEGWPTDAPNKPSGATIGRAYLRDVAENVILMPDRFIPDPFKWQSECFFRAARNEPSQGLERPLALATKQIGVARMCGVMCSAPPPYRDAHVVDRDDGASGRSRAQVMWVRSSFHAVLGEAQAQGRPYPRRYLYPGRYYYPVRCPTYIKYVL